MIDEPRVAMETEEIAHLHIAIPLSEIEQIKGLALHELFDALAE